MPSGIDHIDKMFGLFNLGNSVERYLARTPSAARWRASFYAWQEDYPLVLAPVFGLPPPLLDFDDFLSLEATRELFDRMRCVMWVNCLSLPGVALGNGAQLVGRRFHDRQVLSAARTARAALGPGDGGRGVAFSASQVVREAEALGTRSLRSS